MNEPKGSAVAVDGLFARARTGDEAAWRELYESCYPKVIRVIRRRLNSPAMRSLYDSTDFVGDVWKSLAERRDQIDFPTIEALQVFLARAAERKVIDEHRRLHAQKNDMGRHRPMAAWPVGGPDLPSHDPTPSQFAQANEAHDRLVSGQSAEERAVIELKKDHYTNEEIAERSGWHPRKIQRFFQALGVSWGARSAGGRP